MGKVTPDQVRQACRIVTGRDGAHGEGLAAVELTMELDEYGQRAQLMLGVQVGMELVRRYGVLALDDANLPGLVPAEYGPAVQVVLSEVAHRNGMHVATVSRRDFENYLQIGEGVLTDGQWMALEDKLADYDGLPAVHYMGDMVSQAAWRWLEVSRRWVYRPEGWDQP